MIVRNRIGTSLAGLIASGLLVTGCGAQPADSSDKSDPLAAVVSGPETKYHGLELGTPQPRPSFTLTDLAGAPYDFAASTKGKPTLLFFGYTHCPDICPTTMATVATAIRSLPEDLAKELQVVFVTTDPARDTGPVLSAYLSKFDGDLQQKFVGLTGALPDIEAAQKTSGVPVAEDGGQTHSTLVLFYGRDDLAKIAFASGFSPDDVVHDLPLALEQ